MKVAMLQASHPLRCVIWDVVMIFVSEEVKGELGFFEVQLVDEPAVDRPSEDQDCANRCSVQHCTETHCMPRILV